MCHRKEQRHDGYDSRGKRQHDAEKEARIGTTVDLGSLPQLVWDIGFKKGPADDDVRHAGGAQNDHDPWIVVQPQAFHRQEGGNQAAGEKHREQEHQREKLAAYKIPAGKRVSSGQRNGKVDERPACGINQRIDITAHHAVVGEQALIAVKGNILGPEPYLAAVDKIRVADRRDDDEPQRIQTDQEHACKQEIVDEIEYLVASCLFNNHCRRLLTTKMFR